MKRSKKYRRDFFDKLARCVYLPFTIICYHKAEKVELFRKIKEAGKIVVNNETEPTKSYVDETIEADLNGDILETIKILLSLLIGDNIFEKIEKI